MSVLMVFLVASTCEFGSAEGAGVGLHSCMSPHMDGEMVGTGKPLRTVLLRTTEGKYLEMDSSHMLH